MFTNEIKKPLWWTVSVDCVQAVVHLSLNPGGKLARNRIGRNLSTNRKKKWIAKPRTTTSLFTCIPALTPHHKSIATKEMIVKWCIVEERWRRNESVDPWCGPLDCLKTDNEVKRYNWPVFFSRLKSQSKICFFSGQNNQGQDSSTLLQKYLITRNLITMETKCRPSVDYPVDVCHFGSLNHGFSRKHCLDRNES